MERMETISSSRVKAQAHLLGFDLVGVTTADPLREDEPRLESWLAAGMHGTMEYVAEHAPRAARPAEVVEGARSAVVVGLAYQWDDQAPEDDALRGRVSAYACADGDGG